MAYAAWEYDGSPLGEGREVPQGVPVSRSRRFLIRVLCSGAIRKEAGAQVIDLETITPGRVLQWALTAFAIGLTLLVLTSIVLAMVGVYG